jgi:hypothetical protein
MPTCLGPTVNLFLRPLCDLGIQALLPTWREQTTWTGGTPLHVAVDAGDPALASRLIELQPELVVSWDIRSNLALSRCLEKPVSRRRSLLLEVLLTPTLNSTRFSTLPVDVVVRLLHVTWTVHEQRNVQISPLKKKIFELALQQPGIGLHPAIIEAISRHGTKEQLAQIATKYGEERLHCFLTKWAEPDGTDVD